MEFRVESLDGFNLVGMSVECKMDDISGIAPLWERFIPRLLEVEGMLGVWGACLPNGDPHGFTYIAGCQTQADSVPEGMARFHVPAHRYVIHPYEGLPQDMGRHWHAVNPEVLAASGMKGKFDGPWLEWYPDDCHDPATGKIKCSLYTPVE